MEWGHWRLTHFQVGMGRGRSSSPLAPPPWKKPPSLEKTQKSGKQLLEPALSRKSSQSPSTDMELDHQTTGRQEGALEGPTLAQLKPLYEQLVVACGQDSAVCQDLKNQVLALEEAELPRGVPLHIQVSKAERKLQGLHKHLSKLELSLDKLEEKKAALEEDILHIKTKGQEVCAQIAETEQAKATAVSTLADQTCRGASGPQSIMLQGFELDLQKAAEFEQCRPLLQQMEQLVAKIRDAVGEANEPLLPTQLQGTATPVPSPQGDDETQPGVPSFGPSSLRGSRFRVNPYPGPATKEEETYSAKDLGLEGASASEFDAKDLAARLEEAKQAEIDKRKHLQPPQP